jgi:prevent-host-death family protein
MPTSSRIRRVGSSEARANLADLLEAVGDRRERVLIERRGKPPVVMLSVGDMLKLQLLEDLQANHGKPSGQR